MARQVIDMIGEKHGMLTVIKRSQRQDGKNSFWDCVCDCGNERTVARGNLVRGQTVSCGCYARREASERAIRLFSKPDVECYVEGCTSNTRKGGNGLCGKHAQRMRRYGDVNYLTPAEQWSMSQRNSQLANVGSVKPTTYRKYLGRHEHRVVAEEKYGRKIRRGEHVHHIDGNKHNNHPDNLEIMTAEEHARHHMEEAWRKKREIQSSTVPTSGS